MSAVTDPAALRPLRTLTWVVYALYAASVFVGITAIAAIIVNYVKRAAVAGTVYESHFSWRGGIQVAGRRPAARAALGFILADLLRIPMVSQLLDVVHHAVQLPLCIDLALPSQGEASQALVVAQVRKHRLDDAGHHRAAVQSNKVYPPP